MLSAQSRRTVDLVTCVVCLTFAAGGLQAQTNQAMILNDRGLDAAAHSDNAQAERLYREAIQIWRGMGPRYEAHTATALFNLGSLLCNEGDVRQGVQVLEEALELNRRSLGAKNIRTVRNMSLLGYAYVQAGNLDRADATLTEALGIERELYPNDTAMAETLLSLSLSQRLRMNLDEALQFGEDSLSTALRIGGELTSDTALAYENVATVHRLAGRPERALPLFRKARFIYERTLGPDSPLLDSLISQEGLALLEDGETGLAAQEMSQAVQALTLAGPAAQYRLATAEDNLAVLRLRQRKFADAERLLKHALSIEQGLPSRPVYETKTTLELLAQLRKSRRRDSAADEPRP